MRKLILTAAAAASLAVAAIAMPTSAEARFGAGPSLDAIGPQTVQYYGGYYGYRPYYYAPRRYYAPRYYAPRYYAPRYRYYY